MHTQIYVRTYPVVPRVLPLLPPELLHDLHLLALV